MSTLAGHGGGGHMIKHPSVCECEPSLIYITSPKPGHSRLHTATLSPKNKVI